MVRNRPAIRYRLFSVYSYTDMATVPSNNGQDLLTNLPANVQYQMDHRSLNKLPTKDYDQSRYKAQVSAIKS